MYWYLFSTPSSAAPSDSSVSEDAGIEPRTVATLALAVRHSNHSARSHPHRLDLILSYLSPLFLFHPLPLPSLFPSLPFSYFWRFIYSLRRGFSSPAEICERCVGVFPGAARRGSPAGRSERLDGRPWGRPEGRGSLRLAGGCPRPIRYCGNNLIPLPRIENEATAWKKVLILIFQFCSQTLDKKRMPNTYLALFFKCPTTTNHNLCLQLQ